MIAGIIETFSLVYSQANQIPRKIHHSFIKDKTNQNKKNKQSAKHRYFQQPRQTNREIINSSFFHFTSLFNALKQALISKINTNKTTALAIKTSLCKSVA